MSADNPTTEQVPSFCALCISRCGAIATVENGRFVALLGLKDNAVVAEFAVANISGEVKTELRRRRYWKQH